MRIGVDGLPKCLPLPGRGCGVGAPTARLLELPLIEASINSSILDIFEAHSATDQRFHILSFIEYGKAGPLT